MATSKLYVITRTKPIPGYTGGAFTEWFTGRHWSEERPDAAEFYTIEGVQFAARAYQNKGRLIKGGYKIVDDNE
jgi:hypothetical protein